MDALFFSGPLAIMGCVIAILVYVFHESKLAAKTADQAAGAAEIDQLKRRVATLEQLVTDGDHRLAREIDQLNEPEAFRPGV